VALDEPRVQAARVGPGRGLLRADRQGRTFDRPRRIAVSLDGPDVGTVVIARDPATSTSMILPLTPGVRRVELRSQDGADVASSDSRSLSIALFEASLGKR
jgi:hypothetical protein